jgi:hypothetical protein
LDFWIHFDENDYDDSYRLENYCYLQITKTKEKKTTMGGFELSQPLTEKEEKEEKRQKKAPLLLMTVDTKKKEDG